MNISNLENNLQALNAQMQSYFASEEELIYSNSFKVSNIGSEAEPIDDNKLYIRTNYTIPFRINSNETSMIMPPGSYMIVINANARSMGAPENAVYQGQYVIQYSPITGNIYWDNGVIYAQHYQMGGVADVSTNAGARWFYTDEFRNTYTQGFKLMQPGAVFGYTLEPNTEYVPNAGQSAYESNFNFVHDGNLIVENADVNQLRGRDVSVIINNSNFIGNFESPTLVNSRLYNANMSLDNLDTIRPTYLRAKKPNGKISNSNFYNAKLNFQAHINEFTATNMVVDNTLHDRTNIPFEWDNFNVPNVGFNDLFTLNDKYIKLPYIADNSILAANNYDVVANIANFANAHQAYDYDGTYSALYQIALNDFNNFVKDSEQQFNDITNNRGEEQYQELYDRINNVEFTLSDDIGNFWNSYLNTWNNLQNVAQVELKNMANYRISNVPLTANDIDNINNWGVDRNNITAFDVAFKNNVPHNYGATVSSSIFNNDTRWFYWGNNTYNNVMEFQNRLYTGNGNLVVKVLPGYVWQQNNTSNLFANCHNLTQVYNYIPLGLVNASNMFANCSNLHMNVQFYSNTVNDLFQFVNYCNNIGNINIIVNQDLDISRIAGYCGRNLQSVNISSLTSNKVLRASRAFYSSAYITDINLSNFIISSASEICAACYALRNFNGTIGILDNAGSTSIYLSDAFRSCYNLRGDIHIDCNSNNLTGIVANNTFARCNNLNHVYFNLELHNTIYPSVLNFKNTFDNCGVRGIDLNLNTAGMNLPRYTSGEYDLGINFVNNCPNLTSLNITLGSLVKSDPANSIEISDLTVSNFIRGNLNTSLNMYVKLLNIPNFNGFNTTNMMPDNASIDTLNIDLSEWQDTMPFSDDTFYFNHINNLIITFGNAAHEATISNWLHYNSVDDIRIRLI